MNIVRYMPFARFVSCLKEKDGLFVPSPHLFDDQWEGRLPFQRLLAASRLEHKMALSEFQKFAKWMYVSCWHKHTHESFPMWKLYGQARDSILIQTTKDKLQQAFINQYPSTLAYLNPVEYRAPEEPKLINVIELNLTKVQSLERAVNGGNYFPYLWFMFFKHITYRYEDEIRLVVLDPDYSNQIENPKKGVLLDIRSVPNFIEKIIVAPGVDEWFFQAVKDVTSRFGVDCEVVRSSLEISE